MISPVARFNCCSARGSFRQSLQILARRPLPPNFSWGRSYPQQSQTRPISPPFPLTLERKPLPATPWPSRNSPCEPSSTQFARTHRVGLERILHTNRLNFKYTSHKVVVTLRVTLCDSARCRHRFTQLFASGCAEKSQFITRRVTATLVRHLNLSTDSRHPRGARLSSDCRQCIDENVRTALRIEQDDQTHPVARIVRSQTIPD